MIEKSYRWVKIADDITELIFADNGMVAVQVEDKKVCIVKTSIGLKACASKCPHAGGEMELGKLDRNENIVCPVHGYIFNLKNGRDTSGEGYFLKIYSVKEEQNGVFIGFEERILQE